MDNLTLPLAGKVALVTGGSRSIGAAIVRRLAADGAAVAFTFHGSPGRAAALEADIKRQGGGALAIRADAGDPEAVRAAVQRVVADLGGLDILVNNAGIAINAPITDYAFADYERMIAVNVTGVFVATQEAARLMRDHGRIIQIGSSMIRSAVFPTASVYTLTKGAVAGFNRSLARDLGARGITVNMVMPGPTDTDMNPKDGAVAGVVQPLMALGHYGSGAEIAAAVGFLASPQADFITGAELMADGGLTA